MRTRPFVSFAILSVVFAVTTLVTAGSLVGQTAPTAKASLGKLPLYFVENRGVYPDEVKYYIRGADKTLFFTDYGVTFALRGEERGWTVKLDFVGANENVRPEGRDEQRAVISYFTGPQEDWKAGLPTFAGIIYRGLWPGIDLVYRGTVNALKYEFVVAPGTDPTKIRLRYRGVEKLAHTERGALRVETPEGGFEDAPPVAWQDVDGERQPVDVVYAVGDDGGFGFTVGDYDRTRPLVLDPAVLVYCGYIGGSSDEEAWAIAVDAAGNAYVTGGTRSTPSSFPVKVGPNLTHNGGGRDVFVAKVNAQGTGLVYCGYIGGSDDELAVGIAVDAAGSAYVTGATASTELTFPVTVGPGLTYSGGADGFVAKVNALGTGLDYCGYIGGNSFEVGRGIAVDAAGNAFVVGDTNSTEQQAFPVTVGPDLTHNGGTDAFVAKVNAQGTRLVYCGYIGGSGVEANDYGIAVDAAGNAYVTGDTGSTEQQAFPVTVGPDLTYNGGAWDAFVAKVNAQGTGLDYCGYLGGSGWDLGRCIALDATGNAYVGGYTFSTQQQRFPVKVGPDLTYNGGAHDGFVAKVNAQGTGLVYCGYLGGNSFDKVLGIAVDTAGNAHVAGWTQSTQSTFPVKIGPDLTYNGNQDAFVGKVGAQGKGLVYCGYIGGSGSEECLDVVVDANGNAYVTGHTLSTEQTFPVKVGPDRTYNGGTRFGSGDAFVAKVAVTLLEGSGTPRPGSTVTLTLTGDAGLRYQLGSSLGTGPIPIGGRQIGLSPDNLLILSVSGVLPSTFTNYAGVIDNQGRANASINIPTIAALVGLNIHTAFVTLSAPAPFGIKSISNTYSFRIV